MIIKVVLLQTLVFYVIDLLNLIFYYLYFMGATHVGRRGTALPRPFCPSDISPIRGITPARRLSFHNLLPHFTASVGRGRLPRRAREMSVGQRETASVRGGPAVLLQGTAFRRPVYMCQRHTFPSALGPHHAASPHDIANLINKKWLRNRSHFLLCI